ncbi:MAG: tetratricopeptide repeat protein [Bdellovibrionota bacterium]
MANSKLFEDNAMKAIKVAHRRKWTSIIAAVFVLLVIIAVVVYHEVKSSRDAVLAEQYTEIENIFNQENTDNHSNSMPKFRDFAIKNPQNPYGWQAAIRSSIYFIKINKLVDAQKLLEAVLPYTLNHELVQIKIRTALAGIYASQNNIPKAIEELTIVENFPHNPMPNQSRFLKAQIYAAANKQAEAKKVLNQIISEPSAQDAFASPDSSDLVHQAKVLLNRIGL